MRERSGGGGVRERREMSGGRGVGEVEWREE